MIFRKRLPPVLAKKPVNLAEWLNLATRDLVPSAQARIRAEVEAHYAEAVQAQLGNGATEPEAQVAVLADLGKAQTAARKFNREYLTKKDADLITKMAVGMKNYKTKAKSALPFLCIFAAVMAIGFGCLGDITDLLGFQAMILLLFIGFKLNDSAHALAGQIMTGEILRRLLLFSSIGALNFTILDLVLYFLVLRMPPNDAFRLIWQVLMLVPPIIFAVIAHRYFRIRQKLEFTGTEGLDLPPHDPAAA